MKKILIALLICGFSVSAHSQVSTKSEKIKHLLELTGAGKLGKQVAENVISVFQKQYPDVNPKFWDKFKKEIKPDDLENMIVPIYDEYFTEGDIDQLIAFYKTPIGKKVIATLPDITQESMAAGQQWGKELARKVIEELEAKGYIAN